jgi:Ca2+/Na+ antiporter
MSTTIFPDMADASVSAQIFMIAVYGYILLKAADIIGDGSEILGKMYGAGIVGGLVIPMLGAVPDGMMILMSGMGGGTRAQVQHELNVGIGTLAGSTIMLLTVPFGIAMILNARVYDHETKKAGKIVLDVVGGPSVRKPQIPEKFDLMNNCATYLSKTKGTAKIMILASSSYLVVQIPALYYTAWEHTRQTQLAGKEGFWALLGMLISIAMFIWYLWFQMHDEDARDMHNRKGLQYLKFNDWLRSKELRTNYLRLGGSAASVFDRIDIDNDGYLDFDELQVGLGMLGLDVDDNQARVYFSMIDINNDNVVNLR